MKHIVLVTLALLTISPIVMGAQTRAKQTPSDFASFWLKFKAAVAAGDKKAVASMTKFPFPLDPELDKAGFIRQFDAIFDKRTRRRFLTARPVKDGGSYDVFCGDAIFTFEKIDDEYKFVSLSPND